MIITNNDKKINISIEARNTRQEKRVYVKDFLFFRWLDEQNKKAYERKQIENSLWSI